MIDPDRIRCEAERRAVRALGWLRQTTSPTDDWDSRLRDLRARGVFVTRSMAPEAFAVLDGVRARLGIEAEVLVHQQDGRHGNAHAFHGGEQVVIGFTGAWLRALPDDELAGVFGHELGHWLDASDPEVAHTAAVLAQPDATRVGRLFRLGREITADRYALLACRSPEALARLEMRNAAGWDAKLVEDVDTYLGQARAAAAAMLSRGEVAVGETHPEHLIRVFALVEFAESDLYATLTGGSGGRPFAEIEDRVVQLLTRASEVEPARPVVEPVAKAAPPLPLDDPDLREGVADAYARDLLASAGAAVRAVDRAILGAFTAAVPVVARAFDAARASAERLTRREPEEHVKPEGSEPPRKR